MPLPSGGQPWPPPAYKTVLDRMRDHDAWYSGDPDRLAENYRLRATSHPANRPSQYRRGMVGLLARWFWGEPTPLGEKRAKVHSPLAADIASGSADLLFSEAPKLSFESDATQDRWDELADLIGFHAKLSEAAEVAAALGGVYLRVVQAPDLAPHPLLTVVHADRALPEFSFGMLRAVTFWTVLETDDDQKRLRHVERYELDTNGNGVVLNALYEGTEDNLGKQVPLTAHPATKNLAEQAAPGVPGLLVSYIPNMLPSRIDRANQQGRSDYEGVESMFDALDETITSWMRDIRLAKGRIIVPSVYLQTNGPGNGASFDGEREIYETLNMLPATDRGAQITLSQFAIRVQEHRDSADYWMRTAVEAAGYSAETFGLKGEQGADQTAAEVHSRERKSFITRNKKINYWKQGIRQIAEMLLALDGTEPERPDVEFPDGVSENPLVLAQTLQAIHAAEAASTRVRVQMLHPDWENEEIDEEVDRIKEDHAEPIAVTDPMDALNGTAATGKPNPDNQGDGETEE